MPSDRANGSVEAALALAEKTHLTQTDKAGEPYLEHPRRVAGKLDDDLAKTVVLLHDVIEDTVESDTPVTEDNLRGEFGDAVADAVVALSKTKSDEPPYDAYYQRVRSNPLALRVKLADIHDNLEPRRLGLLSGERQRYFMAKYGNALIALAE